MMNMHKYEVLKAMEVAANRNNGITHVGGKEKGTECPRTRKGVIRKASKMIGPNPDRCIIGHIERWKGIEHRKTCSS